MTVPSRPRLRVVAPDDPWSRAPVYPELVPRICWIDRLAIALLVVALLAAVFVAGMLTARAAEAQAAVCMEGCR